MVLAGCGQTSHGATPSSATSNPATGPVTTSAGPATTLTPAAQATHCTNDDVDAAVLASLASADGRPAASELPGDTFYGNCGSTYYAVATMAAGPLATTSQAAAFSGTVPEAELFVSDGGVSWRRAQTAGAAGGGGALHEKACDSFSDLPAALRSTWGGCPLALHPDAPGPVTAGHNEQSCLDATRTRTYVRIVSAVAAQDGSAILTAHPVEVHCGGPDDLAYVDEPGTETLDLVTAGQVGVFDIPANTEKALPVADLNAYLTHPELGVFEVYGDPPKLVTGIAEQFHP